MTDRSPLAELGVHVAEALARHLRQLAVDGREPPALLLEVLAAARSVANLRQTATVASDPLTPSGGWPDGDAMPAAPLCVDVVEAGRLLGGLSRRSVERLVTAGQLKAIKVGGARRIRVVDLTEFVLTAPEEAA